VGAAGFVFVSGTTGFGADGGVVAATAEGQAEQAARNIALALRALGSGPDRVVRTRLYVVDAADVPAVLAVHRRHFGRARPAATLVVVKGFVDPKMRVEIEATALSGPAAGARDRARRGP
jgi:enamine deaminase RidA (YjgF/YER057c/UK114 family)